MGKLRIIIALIAFLFVSIDSYSFDLEDLEVRASLAQTYDDNIASVSANEKKDLITKIFSIAALKN